MIIYLLLNLQFSGLTKLSTLLENNRCVVNDLKICLHSAAKKNLSAEHELTYHCSPSCCSKVGYRKVIWGLPCDYALSLMLLKVLVDADKVDLSDQV